MRWISLYFSLTPISILVNDSPTKEFGVEKGLCQGDYWNIKSMLVCEFKKIVKGSHWKAFIH